MKTNKKQIVDHPPGSQTIPVEDVAAGQLLGGAWGGRHLLSADDAHVVRVGELLSRGVRVQGVHVVDGAPGHHHVIERFLEGPHGEVHRADGEQGQGVDPDHDDEEENVEEDLDKADKQLGVEHEHCLVLPRILRVEVDRVEDILAYSNPNTSWTLAPLVRVEV